MTRPSSIPPALLAEAVRVARAVLRRMDEGDVPAVLRRVADSSARRLPPPLLMSLLDELDQRAWLRLAALDEWEEADPDSLDVGSAVSALYLMRPEGWEARVAELVAGAGEVRLDRRLAEAQRENARLERLVEELSGRLEDTRRLVEDARLQERQAKQDLVTRLEVGREEAERARLEAERERSALLQDLERRLRDLDEADDRIDELRRRIARRHRATETGAAKGFGRGSAVEMARDLDRLMVALKMPSHSGEPDEARVEFALPPGVRPDDVAAIDWLIGQDRPATLVVDGYNVAHAIASTPDAVIRRRVEEGAVRLRRLAVAPIHIVMMWDSSLAEERWAVRNLDIRYVPDADDAIVEAVDRIAGPVVVVTDDKQLRDRTRRPDVVAIWSRALVEWM